MEAGARTRQLGQGLDPHSESGKRTSDFPGESDESCDRFTARHPQPTPINAPRSLKMEHSTAILEDANKIIEKAAKSGEAASGESSSKTPHHEKNGRRDHQDDRRKRKGNFKDDTIRHGSGGGRNNNKRHKKGDMGRGEYLYVKPLEMNIGITKLTLTKRLQPRST